MWVDDMVLLDYGENKRLAALAQLVEHGIRNAGVVSSSLTGGTISFTL